jgi:hypothetical protein
MIQGAKMHRKLDMLLAIITFSALILTSSFPATSAADF